MDYKVSVVRAAAILTNAYVAGTVLEECQDFDQVNLYVDFTIGSLTDLQIKVEFSFDNSTWYQESFSSISTTTDTLSLGVHKIAGTGKFVINVPNQGRYVRASAIGTGTVTASTATITAVMTKF